MTIDEIFNKGSNIEGWFAKEDLEIIASLQLPHNPIIFECGTCFGRSAYFFSLLWEDADIYTCDPMDRGAKGRFTFFNKCGKDIDWDKPIDLLFIDDDHTYDTIKENFMKFEPFVKSGGYIVFHDVTNSAVEAVKAQVRKFVDELGNCKIYPGAFGLAVWIKP